MERGCRLENGWESGDLRRLSPSGILAVYTLFGRISRIGSLPFMNSTNAGTGARPISISTWTKLRQAASWILALQMAFLPLATMAGEKEKPASKSTTDPVLDVLQTELTRAKTSLSKIDPAPYYLSYTVYDQDQIVIAGAYGGLLTDTDGRRRSVDVTMRVGAPELDNTHGQSRQSGMTSGSLPLNGDADATSRILWELTDRAYKRAAPS